LYERLSQFLIQNNFKRGKGYSTLFVKKSKTNMLFVQIYVVNIIVGSINALLCKEFSKSMKLEIEISFIRELTFFLGLQIKQVKNEIFLHQSKRSQQEKLS